MPITINGSTGISGVDGSAGTPALQGTDTNTGISFGSDVILASTGGVERARLDSSGRLLVGTTSATASGGVLQISNGITFPGTQSACSDPNTLDDYEEGTFTPTIIGSVTSGTGTYTSQVGRYTKLGNRVQFTAYIVWTAHTGSGAMRVSALPFTSNSTTENYSAVALWNQNIALTASHIMAGYVNAGSTYIALAQIPVGGGAGTTIPLDTAGDVMVSGCYEV